MIDSQKLRKIIPHKVKYSIVTHCVRLFIQMSMEIQAIEFSLRFRIYDNALLLCQEYFSRSPTVQVLNLYIRAYLESGSPIQAATLCKQYEPMINKNPELILLYAQCLFESGKYSEAEVVLKPINSMQNVPEDVYTASIYLLGMIKLRTHRHVQSQTDFSTSLTYQPLLLTAIRYSQTEFNNVILPQQQPRRSLITPKQLRQQITMKTTPKRSISKQGSTASNTVSNSSNISSTNASSTSSINSPLLQMLTPLLKISSNDPSPFIRKLSFESQKSIMSLKTLATYHFKCAKYHEASKVFTSLYELHPHTIEGVDIYSTVLWHLKDEKNLNQLARRSISLAPSRAEPWIATGNLLSLQHNSEAAIQMFQRASTIDKSSSYALALAGHELLLLESLADAAKLFRQAIDRNPNEWSAWYGIGSVHFRQDNFGAAEYYMKKALELNPLSSVLHYIYAMVLRKCGRDQEALTMFDKSLELDPSNLVAAYQKGILLDDTGNVAGAIECLQKAEALAPHEPGVAFMRGKICQSIGDFKDATTWFTEALIYGHPDKKEIHTAVESMTDKMIASILEADKKDDHHDNEDSNEREEDNNNNNNN